MWAPKPLLCGLFGHPDEKIILSNLSQARISFCKFGVRKMLPKCSFINIQEDSKIEGNGWFMFTKHLLSVRHLISLILKEFKVRVLSQLSEEMRLRGGNWPRSHGQQVSRTNWPEPWDASLQCLCPSHSPRCFPKKQNGSKKKKKKKEFTGEIRCSK